MNCGIIGLPNVGKTALFNLLTENSAESSSYPYCTIEPNTGIALHKDKRQNRLQAVFPSAKIVYPYVKIVDVAGLPPGASKGEGLGNQFLSHVRNTDAVLHVVRAFNSPEVSRFDSKESTPGNDLELVETELFLADLEIASRRLEEEPESKYWNETASRLRNQEIPQPDDEGDLITPKPQVIVMNITTGAEKPQINRQKVIYADVDFLQGMADIDEKEKTEFLKEMPAWESSAGEIVSEIKKMLGLVTVFTLVGGKEIKGYNVQKGSTVYETAGKIHTDMQETFARARVYNFEDLKASGFKTDNLKNSGKIRTEGKDYTVEDGDIVEILF